MSGWHAEFSTRIGEFDIDVSLTGPDGTLALIGPNGSGKSTFLRLMTGAIKAEKARFELAGRIIADTEKKITTAMELRNIGYVPQARRLFPHLDVLDNVSFGLSVSSRKTNKSTRRDLALSMLSSLGCEHLANRNVSGLSGGEEQKVAVARALIVKPDLLLLDEPLSALDPANRRSIREFLNRAITDLNKPCIIVTHDVRDIAALNAKICAFEGGRIIQQGSLGNIRTAPANPFIQELVNT